MTDIYETVATQCDADPSPHQGVTEPGLDTGSVPQSSEFSADMGDAPREAQSTSGKKVVRVVRRVVRRVIPAGTEQQRQPVSDAATAAAKSTKASTEDRDDISVGLTSLMGRGRTKDHRPRTRIQDRKDDVKEEVKQEENKEGTEEEEDIPAVETTEEPAAVASQSKTVDPPGPKADSLAPRPGFIPVPKQNLLTPPPGFIPARKTSPGPSKHNPLARPPGFIPLTRTDPLAPPAGFIPKPRPFSVKKPEVPRAKLALLFNSWWSMTDGINIHLQPSSTVRQISRRRGEPSGLMSRCERVLMACSQLVWSLRVVCEHCAVPHYSHRIQSI